MGAGFILNACVSSHVKPLHRFFFVCAAAPAANCTSIVLLFFFWWGGGGLNPHIQSFSASDSRPFESRLMSGPLSREDAGPPFCRHVNDGLCHGLRPIM